MPLKHLRMQRACCQVAAALLESRVHDRVMGVFATLLRKEHRGVHEQEVGLCVCMGT